MLLASLLLACLQDQPAPLALVPRWEIGPLVRLELVKGREDWEEDKLKRSSKTVTPIDVEVLAKAETGWIVRWTFGHTSVVEGAGEDQAYAERMASLNEGMRMEVRLAPNGALVGLADPEALQRHYARVLTEVDKGLLERGLSAQVVARIMDEAKERVLGPGFERSALVEVELLHRCFALPLVPGKKTDYEGELPNPFGGDPFPALGSYTLDAPDLAQQKASLHFRLAVDGQRARELILAWMRELAIQNGKTPPKDTDELPLKALEETTGYLLDLRNGLPSSLENVRTTIVRKQKRVDRVSLRVVPSPPKEKPR